MADLLAVYAPSNTDAVLALTTSLHATSSMTATQLMWTRESLCEKQAGAQGSERERTECTSDGKKHTSKNFCHQAPPRLPV